MSRLKGPDLAALDALAEHLGGDRDVAALVGVSPRSVQRWRCGAAPVPRVVALLVLAGHVLDLAELARGRAVAAVPGGPLAPEPWTEEPVEAAEADEAPTVAGPHVAVFETPEILAPIVTAPVPKAALVVNQAEPCDARQAPAVRPDDSEPVPASSVALAGRLTVRFASGELVSALPVRAARLVAAGGEPVGWSTADLAVVLAGVERSQAAQARRLASDGLLVSEAGSGFTRRRFS